MKRLYPGFFGVLGTCLLVASASWAGPFRMMGYDTSSMGQGGGEVAWGHGLGVLFSNPALLTEVAPGFTGPSFFCIQPFMKVELMERPINADVPMTFYDSDVGLAGSNLDRPMPTAELRIPRHDNNVNSAMTYVGLGISHTLGVEEFVREDLGADDFRFRIGLAILVPTSGLASISSNYPDEREQYFSNTVHPTRFGEWNKMLSLLFGVAVKPVKWLSIGTAIEGGMNVGATLDMYIPEATVQDYALVNAAFDATPTARAIIGLTARPIEWLSIGLVWRDRRYSKVDADAILNLWNYHEAPEPGAPPETVPKRVTQEHLMALDFEPMEVGLAVGARFDALFAQAVVTWNHWSDYLGTHHKRAQENAVWDPDAEPDDDFAFSDTFSVGLGLGYEYLEGFTVTAGGAWRPTPVPDQVGRTNYADADLFNASVGHRFDFVIYGRQRLRLDLALQFWTMVDTTVYKDPNMIKDEFPDGARTLIGGQPMPEAAGLQTNNPGFPGYTIGGWSLAWSASLAYLF